MAIINGRIGIYYGAVVFSKKSISGTDVDITTSQAHIIIELLTQCNTLLPEFNGSAWILVSQRNSDVS
jgi:hypothetical protein